MLRCRRDDCEKVFKTPSGRLRHEKIHHMIVIEDKKFECVDGHKHKTRHAANQCGYRARKMVVKKINPYGFYDIN